MSEEKTNNGIENKVKSLEERINALEIKLEIEREDLDKLKEVSDRDHRKLQKIRVHRLQLQSLLWDFK